LAQSILQESHVQGGGAFPFPVDCEDVSHISTKQGGVLTPPPGEYPDGGALNHGRMNQSALLNHSAHSSDVFDRLSQLHQRFPVDQ
jgi:hypothetical protein